MDWQVGCTGTSFKMGMKMQSSFWKYASWLSEIVDFEKFRIWPDFLNIISVSGILTKRLECTTSEFRIGQKKMAWIVGNKQFKDYYKDNDVLFWVGHLGQLWIDQWLCSNKAVWDEIYHFFLFSYWLLLVIFIKHSEG